MTEDRGALQRAEHLLAVRRHDEAAALAARHLASMPDSVWGWRILTQARLGSGDGKGALDAARSLVRLAPDDPTAHALAGHAYLILREPGQAASAFDEAIRLSPRDWSHFHNRALARYQDKQHVSALADVDRALELHPLSAQSHGLRGAVLSSMGRRRASLEATERALEIDPTSAHAHNNHGVDLLRRGHIGVAASAFDRALAADPHDPRIRRNLDVVLLKTARRGWLLGPGVMLACFTAAELLWPPTARLTLGLALVVVMFGVLLVPLRRLSRGARRHLWRRVRQDPFLRFSSALALASGGLALIMSVLPVSEAESLGHYVGVLAIVLAWVAWARGWTTQRRKKPQAASDVYPPVT
ncbi:MAG TPA: tetratricopeptide repeat protein [Actinomycetes bacterium]|nr:tetratricopeptide repeat protein [Actinomycetes bacterium]